MSRLLCAILICGVATVEADLLPQASPGLPATAKAADQTEAKITPSLVAQARRLRSSLNSGPIPSMIAGIVIWCCCLPCMMWMNERIAVKQSKLQGKAASHAIEVEDVNRQPLEEMNGHIVFLSGDSHCQETLKDKVFPSVQARNCIKLRRIVEMLQWVETGKGTSLRHTQEWLDFQQECPNGGGQYQNPPMPIPSTHRSQVGAESWREACAEASLGTVRVGAYYLGEFVLRKMADWVEYPVNAGLLADNRRGLPSRQEDGWYLWGQGTSIGDVRVRFEVLQCGAISLCGILTRVGMGWTVVPIIREEGNSGESCAREFGFTCQGCPCVEDRPVFPAHPQDDDELLEWLQEHDPEFTDVEKQKLVGSPTAFEQSTMHLKADNWMQEEMHMLGLEEDFLGVVEDYEDLDQLLQASNSHSRLKHCACRATSICVGIVAASMILAPITYMLNYAWLGLLSCGIVFVASLISVAVSICIIGLAWAAARPRLTCVLFLLVALLVAAAVSFLAQAHAVHNEGAYLNQTSYTAPVPGAPLTAAPVVPFR